MRGYGSQWFSHKINDRHPLQLKKSKSWEPFWSYQLNSTANPAHIPQNWAKLAKSAALFSWQLQHGSQDFDFFNWHGCRLFILCEIHCYLCPHIFWVYYFSLSQSAPAAFSLKGCIILIDGCDLQVCDQTGVKFDNQYWFLKVYLVC